MTPTNSSKHGPNNAVAYLVTFPFVALQQAASMAIRAHERRAKPAPKAAQAPQAANNPTSTTTALPTTPSVPSQMVADRVHSQVINGQSVNFYLYAAHATIRIMKRTGGVPQNAWFTQAIADANAMPFTMISAAAWIQETWFKAPPSPAADVQPPKPASAAAPAHHPQQAKPITSDEDDLPLTYWDLPEGQPPAQVAKPAAKFNKKHMTPGTGEIISFGPTQKGLNPKGGNTKKPYWTYVLKIDSPEEGIREFIGEQLAELVASLELKPGQFVTVTPLGKRRFMFDLGNGKSEERHRNEYAIDVHP